MKERIFYMLAAFCFLSLASAQVPKSVTPDYKKIKKEIESQKSEYYYPKLMAKLTERDTTLSMEGFRHLYYGYVFQEQYNPYARNAKMDDLKPYFSKEKLEGEDLKNAISISNEVLRDNPFDLNVMNFLSYAYHLEGNEAMTQKIGAIFDKLIETILSSGDGMTCKTGFHVQSISHEYALLNVFGLESQSQAMVDTCDYLEFEKGKYKIAGMYFDISRMQEHMMDSLGKQ